MNKANRRIAAGYYNSPDWYERLESLVGKFGYALQCMGAGRYDAPCFEEKLVKRMLKAVKQCPRGDGKQWRDGLYHLLPKCFHGAIDEETMEHDNLREMRTPAGDSDFGMPMQLSRLGEFKLLEIWAVRYQANYITVEAKNTSERSGLEDVRQLHCYILDSGMGRLGFLASRNGFSKRAVSYMASIAKKKESLILPFDLEDVTAFTSCSLEGRDSAMRYLERKERSLLTAA